MSHEPTHNPEEVPLTAAGISAIFEAQIAAYRFEIVTDLEILRLEIDKEIQLMRADGLSDEEIAGVLQTDLDTISDTGRRGGRIFGSAISAMASATEGRLQKVEQAIQMHELNQVMQVPILDSEGEIIGVEEVDGAESQRWVCALVNTCKDCLPRHGEVDTVTSWKERGFPKTGFSVCKKKCQCNILPLDPEFSNSVLQEPIRLASRKLRIRMALIDEIHERGGPSTAEERAIFRVFGGANGPEVDRMIAAFNIKRDQ